CRSGARRQRSAADRSRVRAVTPAGMTSPDALSTLERIRTRQARVGVIGLGYVGLPLVVEFTRAGFDVTGFDVDAAKTEQINAGRSYIPDVSDADLSACGKTGRLRA